MNELTVSNFDYSKLDSNISNYLQAKELRMKNLASNFYTEIGKELKEAQENLSNHSYKGCFEEWYSSLGFKTTMVYNLINRFNLISSSNFEEQNLLEELPLSLSYEISKPSAPKELVDSVLNGDITTHKAYQEAIKARKEAEERARQAEEKFKNACDNAISETRLRMGIESKLKELESKEPEVIEKEVIKEVTPPDYEQIKQRAQKLEESYLKASQEANTAKNEARAYKDALETKRLEGVDILSPKNFAIDVNNFLRKISPMLYYGEQFEKMQESERKMFYEQIEKLEIACQDIKRAIDGEKGGANLIIIDN